MSGRGAANAVCPHEHDECADHAGHPDDVDTGTEADVPRPGQRFADDVHDGVRNTDDDENLERRHHASPPLTEDRRHDDRGEHHGYGDHWEKRKTCESTPAIVRLRIVSASEEAVAEKSTRPS